LSQKEPLEETETKHENLEGEMNDSLSGKENPSVECKSYHLNENSQEVLCTQDKKTIHPKIFTTTVMEKKKNINFKVIKNKEKESSSHNSNSQNCIKNNFEKNNNKIINKNNDYFQDEGPNGRVENRGEKIFQNAIINESRAEGVNLSKDEKELKDLKDSKEFKEFKDFKEFNNNLKEMNFIDSFLPFNQKLKLGGGNTSSNNGNNSSATGVTGYTGNISSSHNNKLTSQNTQNFSQNSHINLLGHNNHNQISQVNPHNSNFNVNVRFHSGNSSFQINKQPQYTHFSPYGNHFSPINHLSGGGSGYPNHQGYQNYGGPSGAHLGPPGHPGPHTTFTQQHQYPHPQSPKKKLKAKETFNYIEILINAADKFYQQGYCILENETLEVNEINNSNGSKSGSCQSENDEEQSHMNNHSKKNSIYEERIETYHLVEEKENSNLNNLASLYDNMDRHHDKKEKENFDVGLGMSNVTNLTNQYSNLSASSLNGKDVNSYKERDRERERERERDCKNRDDNSSKSFLSGKKIKNLKI
jgi:hypothetical protein